ncbi:response regulator transcription factor [Catenulispora sp. NF23]|uniref:Response regulator transcription factor n=1 Tax=Catenulispora pinistramenti TaxID=2705254 RepID=A0ABS5L6Y3_9ACTN|nr:response regulator transcription factor [Catenulispora pinistramenti]MBS2538753.1 response regulator transcription factor [Catenulispora pinistramenti]MBS2554079.1 response regulator transcription factor [Catenulispora pinistramenti]
MIPEASVIPDPAPSPIRVILADDQPLIRTGLRVLINDAPDIEVVGEAGTGAEAVRLAAAHTPDVAVMDIRMPEMDGIEATRRITGAGDTTRVVMLTTFDDDEYVYAALRAGASGFLVKDMALDSILDAVRVAACGDAIIAPSITRKLIAEFVVRPDPVGVAANRGDKALLGGVTEREREVLTLVGRGLSNGEIAEQLFISAATAKAHVARLFTKLGARDRVQLVITAYEAGLVSTSH